MIRLDFKDDLVWNIFEWVIYLRGVIGELYKFCYSSMFGVFSLTVNFWLEPKSLKRFDFRVGLYIGDEMIGVSSN